LHNLLQNAPAFRQSQYFCKQLDFLQLQLLTFLIRLLFACNYWGVEKP